MVGVMAFVPPLDPSIIAPLELAAAMPAAAVAAGRPSRDRARLTAAGMRGGLRWAAHPADRRWIDARFELPLLDTPHAGQMRRVGLRHYSLTERCRAVEDRAGLRAAVTHVAHAPVPGRAILAFVHSPAMWLCLYGLSNARVRFAPVAADWYWEDPLREVRDAALALHGGQAIEADGSFDAIRDALDDGARVGLAVDVPGSTPVRFLGKEARVRSGLVRLAQATDAVIVPLQGAFVGGLPVAITGVPIRPGDDVGATLAEVTAAVEAPLLPRPERWMPYTGDLWPDRCGPYRAAYAEDQPVAEVGSVA